MMKERKQPSLTWPGVYEKPIVGLFSIVSAIYQDAEGKRLIASAIGHAGAVARTASLTAERRREIAQQGGYARAAAIAMALDVRAQRLAEKNEKKKGRE